MRWSGFLVVPVFGVGADYATGCATGRIPAVGDEIVKAVVITIVVMLAVRLAKRLGLRRNG